MEHEELEKLPTTLAGLQSLASFERTKPGDFAVIEGIPQWMIHWEDATVGEYESLHACRVYRRIPVAHQGDLDHKMFKDPLRDIALDVAQAPSVLPTEAAARKKIPLFSGLMAYFPLALCEVARLSEIGGQQHHPGEPIHWDRSKSSDDADALMRHLLEKDGVDSDGVAHIVKCAWRSLALAQKFLETNKS